MKQAEHPIENQLSTPEDRLQHDIEELESGSGWRGTLRWLVIFLLAGVAVGAVYYISSGKKEASAPRMTSSGAFIIDTQEPARGKLAAAPVKFKWESISGRSDYLFQILPKGVPQAVVERPVRENFAELTADEAARLQKGTTYIWVVDARGKDGKVMGSGRSWFEL